jgi:hypothetical protein
MANESGGLISPIAARPRSAARSRASFREEIGAARLAGRTWTYADDHCLEYSNAGSMFSPSFDPPGSTILLSTNFRLS